jgi:predicted RNA-binding protein with RPS1 domain
MTLREFVRRDGAIDPAVLTLDDWQALQAAVDEGRTPVALAEERPDALTRLPAATRRALLAAIGRCGRWGEERAALERRRAEAGLPPLPPEALDEATGGQRLRALERAAAALPPGDFADDAAWAAALQAAVGLWDRALALGRREGGVRAALRDDHPQAADFADHAGTRHELEDLPAHRWLALARGERAGALMLTFELPGGALAEQLALTLPDLGPAAAARPAEALLAELVRDPLPGELRRALDDAANEAAITAAARDYGELLGTPPLAADRIGGVHVGGAGRSIGLAVVDRAGQLIGSARIAPTEGWAQRVVAWLTSEGARHVALPTQSPSAAQLAELRRALAAAGPDAPSPVAVRPAALSEARRPFLEGVRRVTPEAASAAVLAQRAAVPAQAWTAIDPVHLGLAEYQSDLDETALAEAFALERALVGRIVSGAGDRPGTVRAAAGSARAPSTLVRSLADLRPGMVLAGVVTSVTRFGAFVDVGLTQQGLIHVSDLADHFVQDPAEVIRPGQQVQPRVLNVDLARGRISLSLRSEAPPQRGPQGPRPQRTPEGPRRGGPGGSRGTGGSRGPSNPGASGGDRARALRDLEKLFDR